MWLDGVRGQVTEEHFLYHSKTLRLYHTDNFLSLEDKMANWELKYLKQYIMVCEIVSWKEEEVY